MMLIHVVVILLESSDNAFPVVDTIRDDVIVPVRVYRIIKFPIMVE